MSFEEQYKAETERDLPGYEIGCEIGRGFHSIVYSAKCKSGRVRGRVVAVKKIFAGANRPAETLHRSLFHPNIVSLLAIPSGYHILEYCPQGTLRARLALSPSRKLSEGELRGVMKGLADGLAYLHKERVVHRNITTENILLSVEWRVKIADFSCAARLDSDSESITTVPAGPSHSGPLYRSPELLAGRPHGFPTDIWSLGALAGLCLAGRFPFQASSAKEMSSKISNAEYTLPPETSDDLRDLISQLLKSDPNERISIQHIPSHSFLASTLPVVPLDLNVLHWTLTQATPSQDTTTPFPPVQQSRYPAYLSKASSAPAVAPAPNSDRTQSSRNFLSDTWKPRQSDLLDLPERRITSMPTSVSDSTGNSTFSLLKREDTAIRRTASTPRLSSVWSTAASSSAPESSSRLSAPKQTPSKQAGNNTPTVISTSSCNSDDSLSDYESDSGSEQPARSTFFMPEFVRFKAKLGKLTKMLPAPPSLTSSTSSLATVPSNFTPPTTGTSKKVDSEPASGAATKSGKGQQTFDWGNLNLSSILRSPSRSDTEPVSEKTEPPVRELPFPIVVPSSRSQQPKPHTREKHGSQRTPNVLNTDAKTPSGADMSDSTRPPVLNTEYLTPGTYKTMKGQVTVLPTSKSLLVDFREGERRKGRKGDEVVVVTPDGRTVKVYSAPHLSTPCCLAEPNVEYTFDDMPKEYWNRYSDAWTAVYQLKQRIPRLVQYRPNAKCTLMANEPFGDVEVVYTPPSTPSLASVPSPAPTPTPTPVAGSTTRIKLRLRQDRRTLEITRYSTSTTVSTTTTSTDAHLQGDAHAVASASVTSKKVLPVIRAGYEMELVDGHLRAGGGMGVLDGEEVDGVGVVRRFLGVCRLVVRWEGGAGEAEDGCVRGGGDADSGGRRAVAGGGSASASPGLCGVAAKNMAREGEEPTGQTCADVHSSDPNSSLVVAVADSTTSTGIGHDVTPDNANLIRNEDANTNTSTNATMNAGGDVAGAVAAAAVGVGSFARAVEGLKTRIPMRPARFSSGSWRSRRSTDESSTSSGSASG